MPRMTPTLSRYVVKEIGLHFLAAMGIVLGISLVRRLGNFLGAAAAGSLPADAVLHLLAIRTVAALPSLLPVMFYVGIILGLGRLYADNEMTALAASGVSPLRIPKIVMVFSLLCALLVAALSVSVRPWAAGRYEEVKNRALMTLDAGHLEPGRFYDLGGRGKRVIFAASHSPGGEFIERVFVQDRDGDKLSIVVSDRAIEHVDEASGYRFLTLLDGRRYELEIERENYEITRYSKLVLRGGPGRAAENRRSATPTRALIGSADPRDVAELQWRLAMPVSVLLLALLAIPLSRADARRGKFARLLVAVMAYIAYRQALGTARGWVRDGSLAPFPGIWWVHLLCLAGVLAYLAGPPLVQWWERARKSRKDRWSGTR